MATKTITVFENRILGKADLGSDKTICYGETLELKNNPKVALPSDATWLWSTGDTTEVITIDTIGEYSLTLTSGQCNDVDLMEVEHCPIIFAPNAFTPNEDGKNDQWGLKGVGIREFELYVFDRWGLLLFEAQHIDDWWDGSYQGRNVQQDVYVWKAIYSGLNSNSETLVGTVTILK